MKYERDRDIVYEYCQLDPNQQDFISSLTNYLGSKPLSNDTLYKLLTGPLYDCLKQPGTRCLMEAIQECANIKENKKRAKLRQEAESVGIISRDTLKALRNPSDSIIPTTITIGNKQYSHNNSRSILSKPKTEMGRKLKTLRILSYQKICKVLQSYECYSLGVGNTNGSHESRYSPISKAVFHVVIPHGAKKDEYRAGYLRSILLHAGIGYDDFASLYYAK